MSEELGKIRVAKFGLVEARIGFSFTLGGESWGVSDFWGTWAVRTQYAKWSVEEQTKSLGEAMLKVRELLVDAKVQSFDQLVGIPVEVTLDGNTLSSWRILTEVI